ncbi:MAG TPA: alpha/beta hydrolase, partial [Euzebya sp.]|nr:alpha/beta hydrolase [Euzebya sp.]
MKGWFVVVLGVVIVAGLLWGLQRRLIYFPSQAVALLPGWVEEVETTTGDGLTLRGWVARRDRDEPLLLVFHGNGGTGADRLPLAEALRPHGVAVLLTEYRGYGGNPGTPSEEGLARDAVAWRSWADAHHDGPVAYLGESLGAAVATRLATAAPPAALVLRSPFTSLAAVGGVHYPFLPLRWLLSDRFEVADRIADVDAPVLVIAGDADEIVPPAQSRAVHEAATQPERLVEVAGARHNDLDMLAGEQVIEAIVDLLR